MESQWPIRAFACGFWAHFAFVVVEQIRAVVNLATEPSVKHAFLPYWWSGTLALAGISLAAWVWAGTHSLQMRSKHQLTIGPLWSSLMCICPIILLAYFPLSQLATLTSRDQLALHPFGKSHVRMVNLWAYATMFGSIIEVAGKVSAAREPSPLDSVSSGDQALAIFLAGSTVYLIGGMALWLVVLRIQKRLPEMPLVGATT